MHLNSMYQALKVEENLLKANYAEQFFNISGQYIDLIQLYDYFDSKIQTTDLKAVLAKGIISTTMLRHISEPTLTKAVTDGIITPDVDTIIKSMRNPAYYDAVLASVQKPENRLFLDVTKKPISASLKNVSKYYQNPIVADLFSPPFPLDEKDAMGFFREGTFGKPYLQEQFGSAIIELRGVWFVKKLRHSSNRYDMFLADPICLKQEMSNFYDWLLHLTIDS
jgi:hypothetical protein